MRVPAAALAALLAVPPALSAPAAAQEAAPLEERFYRAYYAENGLRDFERAAKEYAEVAEAARAAERKDLAVKALLGRARCLRTAGRPDEAEAAIARVIEMDPENEEARGFAAAAGEGGVDDALMQRIRELVWNGLLVDAPYASANARELRLLGDRCLPVLEDALDETRLALVEAAATYLASLQSPAASDILIRAMRDPGIVFRSAIAQRVVHPTEDGAITSDAREFAVSEVPVLAAAAEFPGTELREWVVNRLYWSGDALDAAGLALFLRLATDPDRSVRVAVLERDLSLETTRALEPALRRGLASGDSRERLLAVSRAVQYTEVRDRLAEPLRGLLRDPEPGIRSEAFKGLVDALSDRELAAMLDPADSSLASRAAIALKGRGSWSEEAAARVREGVSGAIRGEFPDDAASFVLDLALHGPGANDRATLVDLFVRTAAPDAKARPSRLETLRQSVLQRLLHNLTWDQSPQREQAIALVEEGVEKCLALGHALHSWVRFWDGMNFPAPRAWLRAAGAGDARARTAAYQALVRTARDLRFEIPPDSLPHLAADLVAPDREMRAFAFLVAEKAPSPALERPLRELLAMADRSKEKEKCLEILVASAGRAAEDAVRSAFADGDLRHTALRLLVNDLGHRDRRELDAFVAAGGDPYSVVMLAEYPNPPGAELLRAFVSELPVEKYTQGFLPPAARRVEGVERLVLLRNALACDRPGVRYTTTKLIGDLRVLEMWPDLLALLEGGDPGVRAQAETSLATLKAYAELKSSFARFGKDEQASALRDAEALLKDGDPLKRKGAVLALAAIGDRSAIPVLLRALDDESLIVREAALAALERLGGAAAPR